MPDDISASRLEDGPRNSPRYNAWNQRSRGDLTRRQRAKGSKVERDVEYNCEYFPENTEPKAVLSERAESRERSGKHETNCQYNEKDRGADHSREKAGSRSCRNVPNLLHRKESGLCQSGTAVGQTEDANNEAEDGTSL